MSLFYLLVCLMILGFGAIAFVIIMEKKKEAPPAPGTPKKQISSPSLSPHDLLDRLGLEQKNNPNPSVKTIPLPDLLKNAALIPARNTSSSPPPATAVTDTKAESELSLKYDELLTEHKELQEKFNKMETLFAEKSLTLERSEKALSNELKNQKEFNKVKDILEKELKDAKDKAKNLQADVSNAQMESQTYTKRISQLEEKVKKLEVEVLTSEAAINDGQAGIQLARKHAAELEEKIRAYENVILEKNQKIEDLVNRLNLHPPTNELPPSQPGVQTTNAEVIVEPPIVEQEPQAPVQAPPEPLPIPEPPISEPAKPEPVMATPEAPETPQQPTPALEIIPAPEQRAQQVTPVPVVPAEPPPPSPEQNVVEEGGSRTEEKPGGEEQTEPETASQTPEKPAESSGETLSLPPDIFANPKKEEPQQGETP